MPRFLVEVPHEAEPAACARAAKVLLEIGSHWVTNADFGCMDGEHRAWIILEGESKTEVRNMLPPVFRSVARVVGLNKFTLAQMEQMLKAHQA